MSEERTIPTPGPADLPTLTIKAGGSELKPEYKIFSVTVEKEVNRIPTAQVILHDGDVSKEDFKISNSDDLIPGNEIEILAGYHSDETTIFKGVIVSHGLKARKNKPSLLYIECKDKAFKMTMNRKSAYYTDSSDSDILEEITGSYGLDKDVESISYQHKEMVKYYATDWDFCLIRSEVNGKLIVVDDGKVTIKAPEISDPALELVYGATMMEFEAEADSRYILPNTKSSSWDYASQALLEEENDDPGLDDQGNFKSSDLSAVSEIDSYEQKHTGGVKDTELKSWADARMIKSRLAKIIGRVKCQGYPDIKPGNTIKLSGVGDRFNGSAFVSAIRQQINEKNWLTDIQFGLKPEWFSKNKDVIDAPSAGLLPGITGLQVGIVTQVGEDPDGEDRIKVKMPVISPNEEGIWARIATLDAGENRGSFFRPEIDDEVLIGFLNDDPRYPVVLGMMNSSAKPAPLTASDDNHEKGFVTRSEMKVIFNDDEKSINIETPNGNQILISEKEKSILIQDENGNKMEMSADGITMESAKDINIKATGDVNIEGVNINVKASAQFKAEGSAGAEVSSGATATLKGSLVQIN